MDLYTKSSYQTAMLFTENYSSSFGASCKLIDKTIRNDIYAVYGLVRLADEIVDTYRESESLTLLDELESETYAAIKREYSTNPIVHAFAITAKKYGIRKELIAPFFESMRMDINGKYNQTRYKEYIYGSAEVVGLMCLRVFVTGDNNEYEKLKAGAQALGSAYQKVNFLRDIKADHKELGRMYFPGVTFEEFSDEQKKEIEADIDKDYKLASQYIPKLPKNSRAAVDLSYKYYTLLLDEIKNASAKTIKSKRIRISDRTKLRLLIGANLKKGF